jgi:NADH-quinone oxidoreductase subunit N
MPPVLLELFVLALGILILILESFSEKQDRKIFAFIGIIGLLIVFLVLQAGGPAASGMTSYVSDAAAIFFKKIAVITTIIVLIMSIDYSGTIRRFLPAQSPQAGLGEFFALPVLTCAGMMWMASAIDFILIFVSLELVTVSFYVLVPYLRRNASSLEAGVKYLILSALSTGFTVYGITWIYGITRQTNLSQIEKVLPSIPVDNQGGLLFGALLVIVGLGLAFTTSLLTKTMQSATNSSPQQKDVNRLRKPGRKFRSSFRCLKRVSGTDFRSNLVSQISLSG